MMRTIAVRLTGGGMGAIGVVLAAGERAGDIVRAMVRETDRGRVEAMRPGEMRRCTLINQGGVIDDALAVRTALEQWELHVHGGTAVVAAVMQALAAAGARIEGVEEAGALGVFGSGIGGEIAIVLPRAKTLTGARLVAGQITGGLGSFAGSWIAALSQPGAAPLWRMQSEIQWTLRRSDALMGLIEPRRIAIVGPPNAGKSTLANALLGRPASITSDVPGTTRDWVENPAVLSVTSPSDQMPASPTTDHRPLTTDPPPPTTVPVILVDTAGFRETGDALEREAMARGDRQARAADVIVLVLDGARPLAAEERALAAKYAARPLVIAVNKMDVADAVNAAGGEGSDAARAARCMWPGAVAISALRGDGMERLMGAILDRLDLARISADEAFAFMPRQQRLLAEIALAADERRATNLLRELLAGGAA